MIAHMIAACGSRWPFCGDRWNWGNVFGSLALFAVYMAASIAG